LDWLVGINLNPNKKFLPLGSNIAFKKHVLEVLERGTKSMSSTNNQFPYLEDNLRLKKVLGLGFSLQINHGMVVYHRVPQSRMKIACLVKRCFKEGYSRAAQERSIKILTTSFINLIINPLRFIFSLDINRLFRTIADAGYILYYIRNIYVV
jgi:hypothetical protein